MVAYLKKPTGSEGFQEIVDFLNGSHIRYALTKNPTIYVSLIEKFWQTATVRTVDNGEQEINATVDGKEFTITEASVRRHLQLADADGISVLPNTEIFAQLSLMGYVLTDDKLTFQKVMKRIERDSSKHGRMVEEIDQDAGVTLLKMFTFLLEEEGQLGQSCPKTRKERGYEAVCLRLQEHIDETERQKYLPKVREELTLSILKDGKIYNLISLLLTEAINPRKRVILPNKELKKGGTKPLTLAQQRTLYVLPTVQVIGSHTLPAIEETFLLMSSRLLSKTTMRRDCRSRMGIMKVYEAKTNKLQEMNPGKCLAVVKERFRNEPTRIKRRNLALNERLFEPDNDDTLWKLQGICMILWGGLLGIKASRSSCTAVEATTTGEIREKQSTGINTISVIILHSKRVLEGLKSYNNDVKHGYVTPSLSNEDVEYLQLFEEEIEERLKHRDQMRRGKTLSFLETVVRRGALSSEKPGGGDVGGGGCRDTVRVELQRARGAVKVWGGAIRGDRHVEIRSELRADGRVGPRVGGACSSCARAGRRGCPSRAGQGEGAAFGGGVWVSVFGAVGAQVLRGGVGRGLEYRPLRLSGAVCGGQVCGCGRCGVGADWLGLRQVVRSDRAGVMVSGDVLVGAGVGTVTLAPAQRRLEVKARSTLMMGIPNEHQLKFNSIKDAKQLLEAIEKRFGGNLLRSLSPDWNTHVIVWRNTTDLDTMSMDDLYKNLKVYEPEVKGMSSSSSSTQNMAFVSSLNNNTSSSNEAVNVAYGVTTASTQVNTAYSTNIDNLSDVKRWQMAMLTMRSRKFLKNTRRKLTVNGNETIGFDKAPRNQDNKNKESLRRSVPMETSTSTSLVSCDGIGGYDWSDQAKEGPNYALMAYSSSSSDLEVSNDSNCSKYCMETIKLLKSQNNQLLRDLEKSSLMVLVYKTGLESVEEKLEFYKKNEFVYVKKINGLKWDIQVGEITIIKLRKKLEKIQKEKDSIQFIVDKFENASKSLDKLIECQIINNCKKGLGYEKYNAVSPPYIGNFMPPTHDLSFTGLDKFVNKHVVENKKSNEEVYKVVIIECQIINNCKKGLGYEKYNAVPPPYIGTFMPPTPDLSFTGLDKFVNKHVVENKKSDEEVSKVVRKSDDYPIIEDWVLDSEEENTSQTKIEKKIVKRSIAKIEFVKPKQQEKTARKTVKQVEKHGQNTHSPRGNQRNWNNMMSKKLGSNFEMFNKACYVCGSFDHLQVDCIYHQKEFQNQRMVKPVWNNAQRVNHQNFAKKTHPCAKKNMVPRAVLMKSGLVSINTARQNISKTAVSVNTAHSKTTVNVARPMSYLSKIAHLTVNARPMLGQK
ncbi:hypothetical protein Tco_1344728 [Tanacetum coccineum]